MTDFDARWKELARAATRAEPPHEALSEQQIDELASLARPRVLVFPEAASHRRWEARALFATAALIALLFSAWLRDPESWRVFASDAAERVASLPDHVPSAPRLPSPSRALASLPDLGAFVRSFSIDVETSR